jgi:hypothetical protein
MSIKPPTRRPISSGPRPTLARATAPRPAAQANRVLPTERRACPKCGKTSAYVMGRSESYAVLYLRCEACHDTSVAPA